LLVDAARRSQLVIRRQAVAETAKTWQVLDFDRLAKTWPTWLVQMTDLLTRMHAQSADMGALAYRALRQYETGDPGTATVTAPPAEDWLARALGYSAAGVFQQRARAGATPDTAARSALTTTLGTAARVVLDGGRSTVVESVKVDDAAVGFYRVTDGDPCYFCALISSKGIAYKTRDSAGLDANVRFDGDGIAKFHNDCGCSIAPAFSRDVPLDATAQAANDIYFSKVDHLPNKERLNAFRKLWADRV
jgi:hypothetical protein